MIRTDTLYGIVACAGHENAVDRVYAVKGRDHHKSCIVLLPNETASYGHQIELRRARTYVHTDVPTSIIIDAEKAPPHLLRENNQLAYRIPNIASLRELLRHTGPLIAPSANPQSEPPARTIDEAIAYFGDKVDVYVDGGEVPIDIEPSHIVRVHPDGRLERLR